MPPVSRGFAGFLHQHAFRLPSSLRAALFTSRQQFFRPNAVRRPQSLASSVLRRYQSQYRSRVSALATDPVLRQVVRTHEPVLLYHASKNNALYYLKVYGTAVLWIGTGCYSLKFAQDVRQQGLPFFVVPTYIFVGVAFIIIGCYTCTAPSNRMRMLQVVPSLQGGPMQFRMTVRPAPWLGERVIYSDLSATTISEKTWPMVEELLEADRARRQNVFDPEGLEHMPLPARIFEYSARWIHQKWTNFFLAFKYNVLRFGIAAVNVEGQKWKVDCSGWLLEDGKGMSSSRRMEAALMQTSSRPSDSCRGLATKVSLTRHAVCPDARGTRGVYCSPYTLLYKYVTRMYIALAKAFRCVKT